MSKHTSGPWKADLDRYPIFIESETEQWPLPDEDEGWAGAFVANVGENKANARLIAAAPDLLEALEDIADMYDYEASCGDLASRLYEAKCLALTAIAKARGER